MTIIVKTFDLTRLKGLDGHSVERARHWRQQRHPIYPLSKHRSRLILRLRLRLRLRVNVIVIQQVQIHSQNGITTNQAKSSDCVDCVDSGQFSVLCDAPTFNNFRLNSCLLSVHRFFIIKTELKTVQTCRRSTTPASLKLNSCCLNVLPTSTSTSTRLKLLPIQSFKVVP